MLPSMVRATPRVRRAKATSSGRRRRVCRAREQASERCWASSSSGHSREDAGVIEPAGVRRSPDEAADIQGDAAADQHAGDEERDRDQLERHWPRPIDEDTIARGVRSLANVLPPPLQQADHHLGRPRRAAGLGDQRSERAVAPLRPVPGDDGVPPPVPRRPRGQRAECGCWSARTRSDSCRATASSSSSLPPGK